MEGKIDQIRELLDKWNDGATVAAEERLLESFFLSADMDTLPDDLKSSAVIFRGENGIRQECFPETVTTGSYKRNLYYMMMAVAASVAIVFLAWGRNSDFGYDYDGSRITEQSDALASTEYLQCLSLLEDNFNIITNLK